MENARTFSFAGSIAAVSWRVSHVVTPGVGVDVAVVADATDETPRVICVLTARLSLRETRAHLSVDRRHLATFRFTKPTRFPGLPDDVYRHVAVIPRDVALDWRTHTISIVLNLAPSVEEGDAIARVEAAFYASRMLASRPHIMMPARTAPGS